MSKRVVIFNNMITPYTNRLFNELAGRGLDLAVLSCTRQEANRSWANTLFPSYSHRVLPGWEVALSESRFAHVNFGIWRQLRKLQPDLLLINGIYPSMLIAALWALLSGTKLGLISDGWRHTMPQSVFHRVIRPMVLSRCEAIVACGRKGVEYFVEERISPQRVFEVPLVPVWDAPEAIPDFGERPYHLLWCAHINDDVKNVAFFEDVVLHLKERMPNLAVRLVGQGTAQERVLANFSARGIAHTHQSSVHWREMAEVFSSARLMLFPSKGESWGMVCNEALQCGTPVIVSPFVGAGDDLVLPEVNGHVLPFETERWVDRIYSLLRDETLWRTYSENARESMKERGIERSVTSFLAMVDRTL